MARLISVQTGGKSDDKKERSSIVSILAKIETIPERSFLSSQNGERE
jgi:hypothetical protein